MIGTAEQSHQVNFPDPYLSIEEGDQAATAAAMLLNSETMRQLSNGMSASKGLIDHLQVLEPKLDVSRQAADLS